MQGVRQCLRGIFKFPSQGIFHPLLCFFFLGAAQKGQRYPNNWQGSQGTWLGTLAGGFFTTNATWEAPKAGLLGMGW